MIDSNYEIISKELKNDYKSKILVKSFSNS